MILATLATGLIGTIAPMTHAEVDGWLRWRGPSQAGTSFETNLPDAIDVADARWTFDKRGRGAPVMADGKVFSVAYEGEGPDLEEMLVCLDEKDGSVLWEHRNSDYLSDVIYNRYGITSPSIDPATGNVFYLSTPGDLHCFTPEGELLWRQPLVEKFGRLTYPNGRTVSSFSTP
jgi:outer membrane protein assembly factor BamB